MSNTIAISSGANHILALKSDGTVVAWGKNNSGQANVPAGLGSVIAVAGGWDFSLALKSDGTVVAWGTNTYGQINVPHGLSNVVAIAAAYYHSLALRSDGTVVAWGPTNSDLANVPSGLSSVSAIAAGWYHCMALKSNGTVVAWGGNSYGETNVPPGLSNVVAIAGGGFHSLALKSDGTVVAWGDNSEGQASVPSGLSNVVAIAGGYQNSLALKSNGAVVGWGRNSYGQTIAPPGLSNVMAIAAGFTYSLALTGQPVIQTQPQSQPIGVGADVKFICEVLGAEPFAYQWFFNTTKPIAGAINAFLNLTNVQFSDAGAYRVVVSNRFGSVTSSPAMLTVVTPPVIASQPANLNARLAGTVNFTVVVVGVLPLAYQWFFGTEAILGATNSTLCLTNVQLLQSGIYTVVITNLYGAVTSTPAILGFGLVTNCTEAALRTAMASSASVTFACDGTITLANTISNPPPSPFPFPVYRINNVILDGTGHQITISGGNAVRVFNVGTNNTLALVNLTVANGFSTNGGGAICIQSGMLCATNCTFTGNTAMPSTNFYSEPVNVARGGAILNEGGNVSLQNCQFTSNSAIPVLIYDGYISVGAGEGGAIFNTGSLIADNCRFVQNSAAGGVVGYWGGADGDPAYGGAIYDAGSLVVSRSSFISNSAVGGEGYPGSASWGVSHPPGPGGDGADAAGSAIYSDGTLLLANCTVAANTAIAGSGGEGGYDLGDRYAPAGKGGSAYGAICAGGVLVNVSVAFNSACGGGGSLGGSAVGGISGCSLTNCTVASNYASAGYGPGSITVGGGTMGSFANTLLVGNMPSNCSGTVTDAGHNLSSDASCAFSGIGSMNNTDPKLGPLADNGGPTLTMALLPGSPAIDAGSAVGAPATDQRGIPRPQGAGVDIGAFEYQYSPAFTSATIQGATNRQMQFVGVTSNLSVTLQVSTNLLNWWDATNFLAGSNGVFQCVDPIPKDAQARFYRLKSGTP